VEEDEWDVGVGVAESDRLGGLRRRLPCGEDGVSYGAVGEKYEGASESESSSESKYWGIVSTCDIRG
jgi:hypothetical protein